MRPLFITALASLLTLSIGCSSSDEHTTQDQSTDTTAQPAPVDESSQGGAESDGWSAGDTIPSGIDGVPDIQILEVHANGSGEVCGTGRTASLKYVAMLANGDVLDPGTRPYSFQVGPGNAIKGWHIIVSKMRIGDSFTVLLPQQLAYGPSKGDLKFDMELLSVQ